MPTTIKLPFSPEDVAAGRVKNLSLLQKAKDMRSAIDAMEIAMMGAPEIVDLPEKWREPRLRDDITVTITLTAKQVYQLCEATERLTEIINSDDYTVR